jgi:hypothetical protein
MSYSSVNSVVQLSLCNKFFTKGKFLRSAKKNCSLQNFEIYMLLLINNLFSGTVFVYRVNSSLIISERWMVVNKKAFKPKGGLLCANFYISHF